MPPDAKKTFPTHPLLIGKKLYLRPATAEDIANTHHWFLQSDSQMIFYRPHQLLTATEAAELFKRQEKSPDRQELIMARQSDNMPVGRIRYIELNTYNRSVELFVLVDPDEQRKGHGSEGIRILCHYAFRFLDLNRIYGYACVKNSAAIKLIEHLGFRKEGTLRNHFLFNGEYQDGVVASLLRFELDW